jgi:hypothetical protein
MNFQRQGCVLSNDYEELSIVKTKSTYIPLPSHTYVSPTNMSVVCTNCLACWLGHVTRSYACGESVRRIGVKGHPYPARAGVGRNSGL